MPRLKRPQVECVLSGLERSRPTGEVGRLATLPMLHQRRPILRTADLRKKLYVDGSPIFRRSYSLVLMVQSKTQRGACPRPAFNVRIRINGWLPEMLDNMPRATPPTHALRLSQWMARRVDYQGA
jgi:hypothetical protein